MSRENILLVEDDEDIGGSLKEFLERKGFSVTFAKDGKVALEVLQEDSLSFSFILLDLMMPVMGGSEFLNVAREQGLIAPQRPRVIVLTAAGPPTGSVKADAFLSKPFKLVDLLKVMDDLRVRRSS